MNSIGSIASTGIKRAGALFLLLGTLFAVTTGTACNEGREGDRCNPARSSDECNAGLTCQQPATCAENYCCPADPSKSTDPYCNGSACPAADGGAGASGSGGGGGEAGTSGAGGSAGASGGGGS